MHRRGLLLTVCFTLLLVGGVRAADMDWPATNHTIKPWTRWWWLGSILNEKDVTAEMEKYAAAGLGGLEITPIYGVRGQEAKFLNYLSPEWMKQFKHVLAEAKRLDLGIDMATGNGWPFGGPWVPPDDASKYVAFKTYSVTGGGTLAEPVTFMQTALVRAVGPAVPIENLKDPVATNPNMQELALDQVRFPKPLPLMTVMAYSADGQAQDLTSRVNMQGKLDWTAPPGQWTVYAVFQGWHGKQVERAGPGGEGDVIDHFNAGALNRYLKKFDDAFAGFDLGGLRGFFNDSYEVDDANGESNWTPRFFEEFQKRRGYDLKQHLPALLGTGQDADAASRVITDFRETISDLLLEEFTVPWQKWAAAKGKIIRNQAHGSPANILDLYAASDIPEQEGNNVLRFKMASSAAHVTGKPLASCEAVTWLNDHWLSTLAQVKNSVDGFLLGGINHVCYHGTAFSPESEPWPGFLFYASVELQPVNPFWKDFAAVNKYVERAQSFLQAGKPDNDVLVYYPIHDIWSQRNPVTGDRAGGGAFRSARGGDQPDSATAPAPAAPPLSAGQLPELLQHFAAPGGASQTVGQALLDAGFAYDFISDRQLAQTTFANGAIRTGGGTTYRTIVVPQTRQIPLETLEKLLSLAQQGATVIFQGGVPKDVPGLGNLQARRAKLAQLATPAGIRSGDNVVELLNAAGIARESMVEKGLAFERRALDGGKAYFIRNNGQSSFDGWITLGAPNVRAAGIFDPMTGQRGLAALRNGREVYLQLAPGDSVILRTFDNAVQGDSLAYYKQGAARPLTGTWTVRFTEGGPDLPAQSQVSELKSWTDFAGDAGKRFSGTAVYSLSFPRPAGGGAFRLDLGRVAETARVKLNGKDLGTLVKAPYELTITPEMLADTNTLEVAVTNLGANRIADMDKRGVVWKRFYNTNMPSGGGGGRANRGPDGQFSAAGWQPRESGLIGPVQLMPLETLHPSQP